MSKELHWGGIGWKSLCKVLISNFWMILAVMIITWFGLGIAEGMRYTPSYTSNTVVAVYPFNKMYTLETSADALGTVSAANEVFNSEMFQTGLKERLGEAADFSLYSHQIDRTYILMLSATSSTPEKAYQTLKAALDYYREISSYLVGDNQLEILSGPDFPLPASNDSRLLKQRTLLTLFMGFAMGCFLVLLYVIRKTYKAPSAVRRAYKNVRFFNVKRSASDPYDERKKKRFRRVPDQEAVRKTALELLQMLRAGNDKSILITSAASGEGKMELTASLARELAAYGKSVVIIETDPESSEIADYPGLANLKIRVLSADKMNMQDDFYDVGGDIAQMLAQEAAQAEVILIEGTVWTGSRDNRIWKEAADTSLAVCRQDKADFYAIDQMMTDLQKNDADFLGCLLYGF